MGGAASAPTDAPPRASVVARNDRVQATVQECVNRHNKLVELNIGADETFPMDELRALYADADDALFKKAVKLFDWSSKGEAALENVKMFSLLMVALLHPSEAGKMERTTFDIAFAIFDADASGNLEVDEFKAMFRALYQTRVSALKLVYTSKAGHAMLQEFAESELSTENMEFVDAVDAWAAMDDAQRGTLAAGGLLDQFVGEAAKTPVNLPAKATAKLQAEYKAASKKEILKVIEKDTFARFNKDRERMEALMKETFKEVDTDTSGKISKDEYIAWAKQHPEVLAFYEHLTAQTHKIKDGAITYEDLGKPSLAHGAGSQPDVVKAAAEPEVAAAA
ncbi:alpha-glucuronidase [Aureococcus anophagefferens]|nr:alpha-glucuronidase [Aureococcus anophagefferens]